MHRKSMGNKISPDPPTNNVIFRLLGATVMFMEKQLKLFPCTINQ